MNRTCDIAVIGAGVVGCAVAREFSRFELDVVLLEANSDLGDESSKGNTAILCSGYDTPPESLERRLVVRGRERYLSEAPALGLPVEPCGALTVAFTDEEAERLSRSAAAAADQGFGEVRLLKPEDAYARAPALGAGVSAALWAPDEAVVDPFSTPYAYALDAVANGVAYLPASPVRGARRDGRGWRLETPGGSLYSGLVINCGGLRADRVEALAGFDPFRVQPVRGQYILFDKQARPLLDSILMPTPTPSSRGVLITPTIFGNVLLGPTAEAVEDRDDRRVTSDGIRELRDAARRLLPDVLSHDVTTTFAGMRPGTDRSGYQILPRPEERWMTVAGIRSTGLSAALGVAEHVRELVVPGMLAASPKRETVSVSVPDLGFRGIRPWESEGRADATYREIVCHCERITLGEVRDALSSSLAPRSLKALKRRTRAMFGRCQGFYCGARIEAMFRAARGGESG